MPSSSPDTFTIGVFRDATAAADGVAALRRHEFTSDMLSAIARSAPELAGIFELVGNAPPTTADLPRLGSCEIVGHLASALGPEGLAHHGLAGRIGSVGFQPHDGRIYEMLVERGGVLVAIQSESRAADALAILHAYGAGNAAIGAWRGRL